MTDPIAKQAKVIELIENIDLLWVKMGSSLMNMAYIGEAKTPKLIVASRNDMAIVVDSLLIRLEILVR